MQEIPFNQPSLVGKEITYLKEAIERGQLSGDGYFTKRCNKLIENLTTAPSALLTHSCTAALEMAAILCDLQPGDEVIMPSFTFVSTANAVVLRGAIPVFVDIDAQTLNIDPKKVAASVNDRTRAIFAVHYAGFPADMEPLAQIARANNLILVEDAAQALGSTYKGKMCGSLGDMATFSFHETKNLISGEGGALTINRPELIERAEIIREKGTNRSRFIRGQVDKYTWVDIGSSFLPGELVASFLCAQLEMADEINARRLAIFEHYRKAFRPLEMEGRVQMPVVPENTTGNGHMFYLLLRDAKDRDQFISHMRDEGIITPFHYIPLHSSPAGMKYGQVGRADNDLPVTNAVSDRLVRLPVFFGLGAQIEAVVSIALKYFR
jgi:dTDP-4-amino-4,6-dideoxygalactose transaminase